MPHASEGIGPVTIHRARRIVTMEPALPSATAIAVADGRVVAVGTDDSLRSWRERPGTVVDDTFAEQVLLPGFIDAHVHPTLPAVLTQFPFIAPESWSLPTGEFPAATTPEAFLARLDDVVADHADWSVPCIAWGWHPLWHGELSRSALDARYGDRPLVLWHRSFHELLLNSAALAWTAIERTAVEQHPEVNWERGHFWENGAQLLVTRLAPLFLRPDRYLQGMKNFLAMLHQAGVTTCLDMGIGTLGNPMGESALIRQAVEEADPPCRLSLTPITIDFLARGLTPTAALEQVEAWQSENTDRVRMDRRMKLMLDGAIFGALSQYDFPGYLDGHSGQWMTPPETNREWAEVFWNAGYQIHAHTNGDLSADLFIDLLRHLQDVKPRFDHRMTLEHFAYTTEDQNRQLAALGALVSANPYYVHILGDIFSDTLLGQDRGSQMVRLGSLERLGVPFALHSDCPMAPLSPLTLARVAATRQTINGNVLCPNERISLDRALRAITIDAAWVMGWEREIGSLRAGKRADAVVLSEDPYEVGSDHLDDITIWGTMFEGRLAPVSH